ncbi:MAG: TlpA family protein disulfide reductase [Angelakisella sp.]|jgi:thiol-disulfide isomerase/thioredoxin|nr:TlpA family protein disulfide reductase [Angelakisella sp.]
MKKNLAALFLTALLTLTLAACAKEAPPAPAETSSQSASQGESGGEGETVGILSQFTASDLDGNEVTQSLFEGHPVTMVNVWATFCGPCLGEMPELGELHQEYADQDFQIVGIVTDTLAQDGSISSTQVELAKQIVQETGAEYTHLLPSEDLIASLLWQIDSVPTTIFVDETGALLGKGYLGARSKDAWKEIIEEKLAEAGGEEAGQP